MAALERGHCRRDAATLAGIRDIKKATADDPLLEHRVELAECQWKDRILKAVDKHMINDPGTATKMAQAKCPGYDRESESTGSRGGVTVVMSFTPAPEKPVHAEIIQQPEPKQIEP